MIKWETSIKIVFSFFSSFSEFKYFFIFFGVVGSFEKKVSDLFKMGGKPAK